MNAAKRIVNIRFIRGIERNNDYVIKRTSTGCVDKS